MTRNQWIGAGCGGAGCLGLIVIVLAGAVVYWSYRKAPGSHDDNYNSSRSSDDNANTPNSRADSSSSMSEDNRHKLFQAATTTQDNELMKKVSKKLGLLDTDGTPSKTYAAFVKDHVVWIFQNTEWISEHNTPEKARAYVDEHIND
jgi:hypothetical protein